MLKMVSNACSLTFVQMYISFTLCVHYAESHEKQCGSEPTRVDNKVRKGAKNTK